uniref:Orf66 n=1 Tax=Pseudo-nitzschia multiseries TaxID=37319 RepID=A0A0G3F658_PSEMU|nr:orf66 [Pseudo-nitzschia multiseries]AKJ77344.1 orf66 [Pseudo-nitzschia multiseries]
MRKLNRFTIYRFKPLSHFSINISLSFIWIALCIFSFLTFSSDNHYKVFDLRSWLFLYTSFVLICE